MTEREKARRLKASATFRNKRESLGEAQVAVWLPEDIKEKLDKVIAAGRFKNRSEAMTAAARRLLEVTQ